MPLVARGGMAVRVEHPGLLHIRVQRLDDITTQRVTDRHREEIEGDGNHFGAQAAAVELMFKAPAIFVGQRLAGRHIEHLGSEARHFPCGARLCLQVAPCQAVRGELQRLAYHYIPRTGDILQRLPAIELRERCERLIAFQLLRGEVPADGIKNAAQYPARQHADAKAAAHRVAPCRPVEAARRAEQIAGIRALIVRFQARCQRHGRDVSAHAFRRLLFGRWIVVRFFCHQNTGFPHVTAYQRPPLADVKLLLQKAVFS